MTDPIVFARQTLETAHRLDDRMQTALDLLLMHSKGSMPVSEESIDYLDLVYGSHVALEELLARLEDQTASTEGSPA